VGRGGRLRRWNKAVFRSRFAGRKLRLILAPIGQGGGRGAGRCGDLTPRAFVYFGLTRGEFRVVSHSEFCSGRLRPPLLNPQWLAALRERRYSKLGHYRIPVALLRS